MGHDDEKREGQSKHIEREFEIGKDEQWAANLKRLFDAYLGIDLTNARAVDNLTVQLLQGGVAATNRILHNAITNDKIAGLQALGHRDIATDASWDPGPGEESLKPEPEKKG